MKIIFSNLAIILALSACADDNVNNDNLGNSEKRNVDLQNNIETQAGLWRTTSVFTSIDMPPIPMFNKEKLLKKISEELSSTICISKEDMKEMDSNFLSGKGNENCIYENFATSGKLVQIDASCTFNTIGNAKIKLNGQMGSKAHDFDTELKMTMAGLGTIRMNGTVKRRYIGDCPEN